jgi:hypothetical protein
MISETDVNFLLLSGGMSVSLPELFKSLKPPALFFHEEL